MRETKLTRALRERSIHNPHEFYNASGVLNAQHPYVRPVPPQIAGIPTPVPHIVYRPEVRGRASWAWQVVRAGHKTDPGGGHWMDNGHKTFASWCNSARGLGGRAAIDAALAEALAWASARYGITEWAKDPYGGYGPAEFIAQRLAQLLPTQPKGGVNMSEEAKGDIAADPKLGKAAEAAAKEGAAAEAAEPRLRKDGSPRLPRGEASADEKKHKAAYDAYVAARAEGDTAGMEANREGYRAYKRAGRERREAARAGTSPAPAAA